MWKCVIKIFLLWNWSRFGVFSAWQILLKWGHSLRGRSYLNEDTPLSVIYILVNSKTHLMKFKQSINHIAFNNLLMNTNTLKKLLFRLQHCLSLLWPFCHYVSPSNEGRHIVLVWFFLPLLLPFLLLLLSEAFPDHNFFVFPDRSIIFGMWVHDHKAVCHVP